MNELSFQGKKHMSKMIFKTGNNLIDREIIIADGVPTTSKLANLTTGEENGN